VISTFSKMSKLTGTLNSQFTVSTDATTCW